MPANFTIPLTGLAANDPVPGLTYVEINFAQGPASVGANTYPVIFVGNATTAGSATRDTVVYGGPLSPVPLQTTQDAINLFGQGSELHRMIRRFLAVNTQTPFYAVAVTESAGAQATIQINILNPATGNGTARLYVGDDFVDTAITSGDTAGAVAANIVANANAKLDWAVTAAVNAAALSGTVSVTASSTSITFSTAQTLPAGAAIVFASQASTVYYLASAVSAGTAGTLTVAYSGTTNAATTTTVQAVILTAKNKGLRGNWLRASLVTTGTGVGTASGITAQTFFTGGTTADSNTTALGTLLPFRYYYVVSAAEDATQLGAVVTQVNSQAGPLTGIRQRVLAGSIDTSANVTTIATGLNAARAAIVWMQNADLTPAELAANMAAVVALEEAPTSFRTNFNSYGSAFGQANWKVPAPRSLTAPTRATIKSALNNGVTPIGVNANGSTYLVQLITTRSLSGSQPDYRTRSWHKVTVMDRYADDLANKFALQFAGKKIADDPIQGQRVPGSSVVTPRIVKAAINKLTDDYDNLDLLQNADQVKANTQSIREASPTTRISNRVPLQPIDNLDQVASALDQTA